MNARLLLFCAPALFAFECGAEPPDEDPPIILLDTGKKDTGFACPTFEGTTATFIYPADQVDLPGVVNGAVIRMGTDPAVQQWLETYQPPEVATGCFVPMGFGEGSAGAMIQSGSCCAGRSA